MKRATSPRLSGHRHFVMELLVGTELQQAVGKRGRAWRAGNVRGPSSWDAGREARARLLEGGERAGAAGKCPGESELQRGQPWGTWGSRVTSPGLSFPLGSWEGS